MENEYDDSLTRTKDDEKLIEKEVLFLPWVGKNYSYGIGYNKEGILFYGDENHKGKKILALGEYNHWSTNEETCGHDGECFNGCKGLDKCSQITRHAVCDHLNINVSRKKWMNAYTKFERSLIGSETTWDDSSKIWDHIMLYNYLQVPFSHARMNPKNEDYKEFKEQFFYVLKIFKPDYIIACGHRLYNFLPDSCWSEGDKLKIDGETIKNGSYKLENNNEFKMYAVLNPSAGYSWDHWNKVIKSIIK
ncbi:hypothetical protein [Xylanibacter oryzae]|uniref:hypothetical protein n=1 Tax=Xylanibacter oryzae TaxID=185293 RepID=UPI0004AD0822|nr:hypothetical protein [Xylanibacter oryzae]